MKYKISWYHGFDQEKMRSSYTCANCQHEVDIKDLYCRSCGMNFITGKTPHQEFRAGYEAAKKDIVNIIQGGKKQ